MTVSLDGRLVQCPQIGREYMLVRVGWMEPKTPEEHGVELYQAVSVMPLSTDEVIERLDDGRIVQTGCHDDPIIEDYYAHDRCDADF